MSLILGHCILYNHRHSTDVWGAIDNNHDDETPKKPLITQIIKKYCKRASIFWILELLIILVCFYTAAFIVVGITATTFSIEIKGLAGYLLKQHSLTEYSILSLGNSIVSNTGDNDTLGMYCLAAIFFFFVVIMPFTCLFISIVLLFVPLSLSHQQMLLISAEIAYAWSALDVFALSMIAAVLQISQFASFVIGDRCDAINGILQIFLNESDVDDSCYDIDASLKPNALFLIVGVVFHFSLTNAIMQCCRSIIKEKKLEQPKGYYALLEDESDDGFQDIEEEFLLYRN